MTTTTKRSQTTRSRGKPAKGESTDATDQRRRALKLYRRLLKAHPDAHCALEHRDPFQLLVSTILSAQCTDERVNMVTPALFKAFPDAGALAAAKPAQLEKLIRSTGFYRNKAKSLKGAGQALLAGHDGRVPDTMEALTKLPGVARKTANVVLGNAFAKNEGVVVDTHVGRLSRRMGLTTHNDPKKVEQDLIALFPRKDWTMLSHLFIFHGRRVCNARKPKCDDCTLAELCPKVGV
jgi:endonuclease-3